MESGRATCNVTITPVYVRAGFWKLPANKNFKKREHIHDHDLMKCSVLSTERVYRAHLVGLANKSTVGRTSAGDVSFHKCLLRYHFGDSFLFPTQLHFRMVRIVIGVDSAYLCNSYV